MKNFIQSLYLVQYADSTFLFVAAKDIATDVDYLHKGIEELSDLFAIHRLNVNADKTEFLVSRRFRRKSRLLQWLVFFSSVQRVTSTFCALMQLMHIYQLLPYVLSTSFSTHPKRLT